MSKKIKYTCGNGITPSACTLYTGTIPSFINEDSLECEPNIDEIFQQHALQIEKILDGINLTGLDKKCLSFVPATVKVKELHQLQITKLCELDTTLTNLKASVDHLNIATLPVTVDLKCLKPTSNPCGLGTDTYSLVYILNLLINEICLLKH